MIVDFEIPNSLKIYHFRPLLNQYSSFRSANRDLKINSLLGHKKMELEISDIKPAKLGYFSETYNPSLKDCSFKVNGIFLGIENEDVIYMKCDIITLKTEMGLVLEDMIGKIDLRFKIILFGTIDNFEILDKFFVSTK